MELSSKGTLFVEGWKKGDQTFVMGVANLLTSSVEIAAMQTQAAEPGPAADPAGTA